MTDPLTPADAARLLEGTTPGPWALDDGVIHGPATVFDVVTDAFDSDEDARLIAAAPALAEALAAREGWVPLPAVEPMEFTDEDKQAGWTIEERVRCVVCPGCTFTFDACHTDVSDGGYSCPLCTEAEAAHSNRISRAGHEAALKRFSDRSAGVGIKEVRLPPPDDDDGGYVKGVSTALLAAAQYKAERDAARDFAQMFQAERDALRTDLAAAVRALREARMMVNDWASYASDYFKQKWDLTGDLASIDAFLAAHPQGEQT